MRLFVSPEAITPSRSFVAVNHFLDRLEKRLQFEVANVPLAIDKKCRRTVYPAAYAAGKVPPAHARQRRPTLARPECLPIKRKAMRQFPKHLLAKRILVFEDQVMHVPELAKCCGKLGRFGGGLGVWMYFSQREVSKDKPQLFSKLLLKRFDDRVCVSTVRAFVVAIFDQSNRGVGGPCEWSAGPTGTFSVAIQPHFGRLSIASRIPSAPGLTAIGET